MYRDYLHTAEQQLLAEHILKSSPDLARVKITGNAPHWAQHGYSIVLRNHIQRRQIAAALARFRFFGDWTPMEGKNGMVLTGGECGPHRRLVIADVMGRWEAVAEVFQPEIKYSFVAQTVNNGGKWISESPLRDKTIETLLKTIKNHNANCRLWQSALWRPDRHRDDITEDELHALSVRFGVTEDDVLQYLTASVDDIIMATYWRVFADPQHTYCWIDCMVALALGGIAVQIDDYSDAKATGYAERLTAAFRKELWKLHGLPTMAFPSSGQIDDDDGE